MPFAVALRATGQQADARVRSFLTHETRRNGIVGGIGNAWMLRVVVAAGALGLSASAAAPSTQQLVGSIPGPSGERLRYSVNWPSGLSLGEMDISASRAAGNAGAVTFDATVDASLPGFLISDHYRSEASAELCSMRFEKDFRHGVKSTDEITRFDLTSNTAIREAKGGGRSTLSTSPCAKDALTFLYFTRNELARGRLPQQQLVYFGAPYNVRLDFGGAEKIEVAGQLTETDRITANIHGPASDITVEIFFAHDAARTPVLARIPVSVGTFSAELTK